jgi:hypothetical protein
MTDAPGLYERLAQARADFQKASNFKKVKAEGLRFAYLPVEAAKPVIEEATAKAGITILPMDMEIIPDMTSRFEKQGSGGYTTSWLYITARVTFRIACPGEYEDMVVYAEAQDNSDKCINKVYTMAYKNLIKIVFGFSESAKDDSKFDDARQQDNDFNQEERRVPPRKEGKPVDRFFDKGGKA